MQATKLAPLKLGNPRESTQNSSLELFTLLLINTHYVTSKTLTGIKIPHTHNLSKQHNTKTRIICTGVAWLGSPAAIALALM